jgi:hypothetical protein
MLSREDRNRLSGIASAVRREDPRFAEGLTLGRPRAPREYRTGRNGVWAGVVVVLVAVDLFLGDAALAAVAGPVVLAGFLASRYPLRWRPARDRLP